MLKLRESLAGLVCLLAIPPSPRVLWIPQGCSVMPDGIIT
jgi:hypothetical protein